MFPVLALKQAGLIDRLRAGDTSVPDQSRRKHMKRILMFCAALLVGIAAPAMAQIQTGSILVRTTDQQGASTPGVAVTISSPVLIGGSMSGVTDAGGVYRFPSLLPGTYRSGERTSALQSA